MGFVPNLILTRTAIALTSPQEERSPYFGEASSKFGIVTMWHYDILSLNKDFIKKKKIVC